MYNKSTFHAATDIIHLLVFYILKGSVIQSAPVLLYMYVSTIQNVEGHL